MIKALLSSKTKTISLAAFIIGISSFISYALGALRDNLLANFLPNKLADVYWAAFRVPDFIYGILITGGITAAFLPVFSSYFKNSQKQAQDLFRDVFSVFFIALVGLSFIFFLISPWLVNFTVPGFSTQQKQQTIDLMRIMFLSPVILGLSAIFSSVLQYLDLFFAFALAPIFYNIGILVGIIVLYPFLGLPGLALGVILGGLLHLLTQIIPAFRAGFKPVFSLQIKEKTGLLRIFKLMVPRTISSAAYQVNLIVTTAIASTLTAGSIKIFNLSNNLYCVPIGLIGLSFASAVFPTLSKSFAGLLKEKFLEVFSIILSRIVFFILPLSGILFILRAQVIRLLYGTQFLGSGYFGWWETRLTASSFGVLSLSLFAACLVPFLGRAFFALHDTKTPLKIAIFSIGLNIALAFFFVWLLKTPGFFQNWTVSFLKLKDLTDVSVLGLAIALSLSSIFQFVFLFCGLKKKIGTLGLAKYKVVFLKMSLGALLASLSSYFCLKVVGYFLPKLSLALATSKVAGLFIQTAVSAFFGAGIYLLLCFLMKMPEPRIIYRYLCRIKSVIL
ncbi:MAG: murein biosynthesis integral membrane protein MurJ [Candidatus Pacebacteria bacterium]|nr:murein biosynthesis integral membrane protein MurJ [Candidatus Paceibacterota bacterium]